VRGRGVADSAPGPRRKRADESAAFDAHGGARANGCGSLRRRRPCRSRRLSGQRARAPRAGAGWTPHQLVGRTSSAAPACLAAACRSRVPPTVPPSRPIPTRDVSRVGLL